MNFMKFNILSNSSIAYSNTMFSTLTYRPYKAACRNASLALFSQSFCKKMEIASQNPTAPFTLKERMIHLGAAIALAIPVVNIVAFIALKRFQIQQFIEIAECPSFAPLRARRNDVDPNVSGPFDKTSIAGVAASCAQCEEHLPDSLFQKLEVLGLLNGEGKKFYFTYNDKYTHERVSKPINVKVVYEAGGSLVSIWLYADGNTLQDDRFISTLSFSRKVLEFSQGTERGIWASYKFSPAAYSTPDQLYEMTPLHVQTLLETLNYLTSIS